MAKLVSSNQQLITAIRYPKSIYSRVVSAMCGVGPGVGNNDYAWTPSMGERLWLLSINAWFASDTLGQQAAATFFISRMTTKPRDYDAVRLAEPLLPITSKASPVTWNFHSEQFSFAWTLSVMIPPPPHLFAIAISNLTAAAGCSMRVSFEVCET